ncbi:hypothetical protein B0H10DRAFT_2170735 [Mycena sp. CBHHK59/15]|nr:hypothetical protein B0H10DRAFT_2170735 [Mycena sp. CBHHK59/15]
MRWGVFKSAHRTHRRGTFFPLTDGVSFSGGQKRPGNLAHSRLRRCIIRRLLANLSIRRWAGFQSSALATYAPKLYRYYCTILKALFDHHPGLVHTFSNSVFPAVTFNLGPDALSFNHRDHLNLRHGLCAITSAGILIIRGSSILIPSGFIEHGNTPIQAGESRSSMTQYAAGGLFRWVEYGFQSAKALLTQAGGKELRDKYDGVPGARWQWALDLFSKCDELAADQAAVFR